MEVTKIDWLDTAANSPLLAIICKQVQRTTLQSLSHYDYQASGGTLDPSNNRGLFVTLPDQQHCYFLTETPELLGQTVEFVPFRHPSQVNQTGTVGHILFLYQTSKIPQ